MYKINWMGGGGSKKRTLRLIPKPFSRITGWSNPHCQDLLKIHFIQFFAAWCELKNGLSNPYIHIQLNIHKILRSWELFLLKVLMIYLILTQIRLFHIKRIWISIHDSRKPKNTSASIGIRSFRYIYVKLRMLNSGFLPGIFVAVQDKSTSGTFSKSGKIYTQPAKTLKKILGFW